MDLPLCHALGRVEKCALREGRRGVHGSSSTAYNRMRAMAAALGMPVEIMNLNNEDGPLSG